jgi:cyclopropane fatty-acyl-phospholipid synthase-like methyltransferase
MLPWNTLTILWAILLAVLCLSMIVFIARRAYAFFRGNANPTISTFDYLKEHMKSLELKPWSTFIDLWCGTGSTLRWFSKHHPDLVYTWVDINTLALWRWRWNIKKDWLKNITLNYKDIYTVDLRKYDYIYCFLMPSEMKRIQNHFETHLYDSTTVICAAFKLPDRTPTQTIQDEKWTDKIFIYKRSP